MTCTWEPDETVLSEEFKALDVTLRDRALMLATSTLQMLTLYRVGLCPEKIRPCPTGGVCGCWGAMTPGFVGPDWTPVNWGGQWFNCSHCGNRCAPLSEVDLGGPVGYVDELKIDGVPYDLTTGDFRLDEGYLMVWQGVGPSPIPAYQNLNLPDTAAGTWSITYSRSHAVDAEGRLAVAYLAMEYAKAFTAIKGKCRLPKGVTSVVRAGVSFSIDQGLLFPGGLTGIDTVDQYIIKWAPAGAPTRTATVFDPRKVRDRRTNGLPVRSL